MGLLAQGLGDLGVSKPEVAGVSDREAPSSGPLGFIGNAFSDLKDIGSGLAQIGGIIVHDVGHGLAEGATFGGASGGFMLDDVAKALPHALAEDYSNRYGDLAHGNVLGFLTQVFEHPLSFVGDALLVGAAGGKVLQVAGDIGAAGKAVSTAGLAAGAKTAGEEAAMLRAGTLPAEQVSQMAQFVDRVRGSATMARDPNTGKLVRVGYFANPFKRAVYGRLYEALLTTKPNLPEDVARTVATSTIEDGAKGLERWHEARETSGLANEALASDRELRPFFANKMARKSLDILFGASKSRAQDDYLKTTKVLHDEFKVLAEHGLNDEAIAYSALGSYTDLTADGYVPSAGKGTRSIEHFDNPNSEGYPKTDGPNILWNQGRHEVQDLKTGTATLAHMDEQHPSWRAGTTTAENFSGSERITKAQLLDAHAQEHAATGAFVPMTLEEMQRVGRQQVEDLTPKLRHALRGSSAEVVNGPLKEARHVEAKAKLMDGGLDAVDDAGARFRVYAPDAWTDPNKYLAEIEKVVKPTSRRIENTVFDPEADGSRMLRAVYEVDGSPVEFQLMPRDAGRAMDVTAGVRQYVNGLMSGADQLAPKNPDAFAVALETAKRLQRTVWAGIAHDFRRSLGIKNTADEIRSAFHRINLKVWESVTGPAIEAGLLSPQSAFDNMYNALRYINGAEPSPEMTGLVKGPSALDMYHMTEEKGLMHPVYYPMMNVQAYRQRPGFMFMKRTPAVFSAIKDVHMRRNTSFLLTAGGREALRPGEHFVHAISEVPDVASDETRLWRYEGKAWFRGKPKAGIVEGRKLFYADVPKKWAKENAVGKLTKDIKKLPEGVGETEVAQQAAKPFFDVDVNRVYAARAATASRARESMDLLDAVTGHLARPINNMDDMALHETAWSPTLIRSMWRIKTSIDDATLDAVTKGVDPTEHLIETARRVQVQNAEDFAKEAKAGRLYAMPSFVARRMEEHVNGFLGLKRNSGALLFRSGTDVWKNWVLSMSPRWIVNNFLGNILFLKLNGGRLTDVIKQLNPNFRNALKEAIGEKALSEVEGSGLYRAEKGLQGRYEEDKIAGRIANRVAEGKGFNNPISRGFRRVSERTKAFNNEMENYFRRAQYIKASERVLIRKNVTKVAQAFWRSQDQLENVFKVGLDQDNWEEAVDGVNLALNNYNALSPLERNVVRPFLAPFWSFYKHAARTLVRAPFHSPGSALLARALETESKDLLAKYGPLPGWLDGAIPLDPPGAGDVRFLSTRGANPFDSLTEGPLNLLHPAWKILYERSTGRSSFTGRPFTSPDVVTPYGSDTGFKIVQTANGPEARPVEKVVPSPWEQLLQTIPQYSLLRDMLAGGKTYDTSSLLHVLDGSGIQRNADGTVKYPRGLLESTAKILGYSQTDFNVSAYQELITTQQKAALTQYLKAHTPETTSTPSYGLFA